MDNYNEYLLNSPFEFQPDYEEWVKAGNEKAEEICSNADNETESDTVRSIRTQ